MADTRNRRPQTDFQTFGGPSDFALTGAADRNARASKGRVMQDDKGFEGSFIDLGNTALNPSSTAMSGGSKGTEMK